MDYVLFVNNGEKLVEGINCVVFNCSWTLQNDSEFETNFPSAHLVFIERCSSTELSFYGKLNVLMINNIILSVNVCPFFCKNKILIILRKNCSTVWFKIFTFLKIFSGFVLFKIVSHQSLNAFNFKFSIFFNLI